MFTHVREFFRTIMVLLTLFVGVACLLILFFVFVGVTAVAVVIIYLLGMPIFLSSEYQFQRAMRKFDMQTHIVSLLRMAKLRPAYPAGWLTTIEIVVEVCGERQKMSCYVNCLDILQDLVKRGIVQREVVPAAFLENAHDGKHRLAYRIINDRYYPKKPLRKNKRSEEILDAPDHVGVKT